MGAIRRSVLFLLLVCLCLAVSFAQDVDQRSPSTHWAVGLSAISPGLPVAVKAMYQVDSWGFQLEANYFYSLGTVRFDGVKTVYARNRLAAYVFAGITANHFYDPNETPVYLNNTLWVDAGLGGTLSIGKYKRLVLGVEGGLLVPFLSNLGLTQYEDSGFIVANVFILWRL
jgi:hypothetical protein